jgi:hypothetical protein
VQKSPAKKEGFPPLPTNNKYDVLSPQDLDDMEVVVVDTPEANASQSASELHTQGKPNKPPPFFIYGVTNTHTFVKTLTVNLKEKPDVKHNKERIRIQALCNADFDKMKAYCEQTGTQYATGIIKSERPIKVVIRKLPIDMNIEELTDELTQLGHKPINITQMTRKGKTDQDKVPMPLYLVSLERSPNTKDIYNITNIQYYRVKIETYRPPAILQCYRCQRMGHSQDTCNALPRCLKCAQGHFTKACTKRDKTTPCTCANCLGDHPANYRGCPVFKSYCDALKKPTKGTNPHPSPSTETNRNENKNPETELHPTPSTNIEQPDTGAPEQPKDGEKPIAARTESPDVSDLKLILDFIKGFNFAKIMPHIKRGIARLQEAGDLASKASVVIATVTEMMEDGCF